MKKSESLSDKLKKSSLARMIRKSWQPVLFFFLPYFLYFFHGLLRGKNIHCAYNSIFQGEASNWLLFSAILLVTINIIIIIAKEIDRTQTQATENLSKKLDRIINNASITFEAGIKEFSDKHLLAVYRILAQLKTQETDNVNIYAIDNSEPRTWWSETMIGYLALLSKHKPESNVHRIFVCQKNELLSPIFAKTIGLHSLMGFKTYVIEYEKYNKILKPFEEKLKMETPKYSIEKEVFIWTKKDSQRSTELGESFPISFQLDELNGAKKWTDVKCYQSFWKINSEYNYRTKLTNEDTIEDLENYYGNKINSKNIKVWFEFISNEKKSDKSNPKKQEVHNNNGLPAQYLELIKALFEKMICCKNDMEVPSEDNLKTQFPDGNFGIEIKTGKCFNEDKTLKPFPCKGKDCINYTENDDFDFTTMASIKDILEKYYKLIK